MKYLFASSRHGDFISEGNNPTHAWQNLEKQLIEDGQVYRCNDAYRNRLAVEQEGFRKLGNDYHSPVYKEL